MKTFVVICYDDEGMLCTDVMNETDLTRSLNNNYWGDNIEILESCPTGYHWPDPWLVILENNVITPKPVKTITEWKI